MATQQARPLYFAALVISILFLFFLAYYQLSQIRCLPYFHTRCGLSANLECRSEMCCTRLAEKYRMQKLRNASSHNFVGLYPRNWGMYRQSEKSLLNSNISSTCPYNAHEQLASQQISKGFASWLRYCTDVAQQRSTKLHNVWPSAGLVRTFFAGRSPATLDSSA